MTNSDGGNQNAGSKRSLRAGCVPWARTRLIQLRLIFLIKTSKPSETLNLSDGLILNKKRVRALGHTRVLSILLHLDCKFKTQNQRSQVEQLKSQIGSLGGNVHIQAAGAYAQQAADVSAARDIDIRAQSIDIAAGRNLGSSHQSERDVKIGSFAKVSSPLIDLVNAVEGAAKSKAEGRTRALQGMAAAAQGYQAYDALSGAAAQLPKPKPAWASKPPTTAKTKATLKAWATAWPPAAT